jgi:hypothetical protein
MQNTLPCDTQCRTAQVTRHHPSSSLHTLAHLAVDWDRDEAVCDPNFKRPAVSVRQGTTLACLRSPLPVPTTSLRVPIPSDSTTPLSASDQSPLDGPVHQRYPGGTPVRCEYRAPRQFARRVRSTRRAALRGAAAVRSSRTGATVRGYSESTQAVRTHLYVREGRADDADVADSVAGNTHEPAVAIGLHTTRRTKLGSAPTKGTPAIPCAL